MLFQASEEPINLYVRENDKGILAFGDTDGNGYPELAVLQGDQLHILEIVPEPSTALLLTVGAVCGMAYACRKARFRGRVFRRRHCR